MTPCERCVTQADLPEDVIRKTGIEEAMFLVTVTEPDGPAKANPPERLCAYHARVTAGAYIDFEWGAHADLL